MIRVAQTILTGPGHPEFRPGNVGDCHRACIASIFEVALADVPHFVDYPDGYDADDDPLTDEHGALWFRAMRRWLRTAPHGVELDVGYYDDLDAITDHLAEAAAVNAWPLHTIGRVTSPRSVNGERWKHSVVVDRHGHIVWDPHPAQDAYGLPVEGVDLISGPYEPPPPDPDPWTTRLLERDGATAA